MESTFFFLVSFVISISFCFIIQTHVLASSNSNHPFPKEAQPTKTGYLPVSTSSSSAIFYAFYEAQNPTSPLSQTPLLIYLQGGPGASSMIANFNGVGPWHLTEESLTLEPNPGSWNNYFGVLFLDNPIGTGFSIASSPQEIPTDQQAGHYILKRNAELQASERVNLVGVTVGDAIMELELQSGPQPANAYYVGLINEKQRSELEKDQLEVVRLTQIQNWSEASIAHHRFLGKLQNMSGLASLLDYTLKVDHASTVKYCLEQFLNMGEAKKALGVNESEVFETVNGDVKAAMGDDAMKSVMFSAEELLRSNAVRVLLYQGQYDLAGGPIENEAWVKTLKWEGIEEYLNAERKIWKVNGELAGYVQQWNSLTNVVVLAGGHLLPVDQPLNLQSIIQDWVLQRGSFGSSPSLGYI